MKKSFDGGFAWSTVRSFVVAVFIVTAANLLVLGLLAQIPFFNIQVLSLWSVLMFGFGLTFIYTLTRPIRYVLFLLLVRGLHERLSGKVILRLDDICGFFITLTYLYCLDLAIPGIILSLYTHLALTFIYVMVYDFITYDADTI